PLRERIDLRLRELLALGRHLQVRVAVADRMDEQALLRISRLQQRPRLAALQHALGAVKREPTLRLPLLHRVTLVAILRQDWPNLALEELLLLLRLHGGHRRPAGRAERRAGEE